MRTVTVVRNCVVNYKHKIVVLLEENVVRTFNVLILTVKEVTTVYILLLVVGYVSYCVFLLEMYDFV